MASADNPKDPLRQNSKRCTTDTNQVNNTADYDCKKTVQLFGYICKYLCPALGTSHRHSVLTHIKDEALSKSASVHTWYYSIIKI